LCPRGCNAIDVGVFWGAVAQKLQDYANKVWAFEPNPEQFEFLKRCKLPKVEVIKCALSDTVGYTQMRVPLTKTGHGTIEPNNTLYNEKYKTHEVSCQKLDSFRLKNIGFIKIDVEGHELSVLRGGQNTISRFKPNILLESNDRYYKNHYHEVVKFMKDLGYKPYVLIDEAIYECNGSSDLEKRASDNIILIHKTKTVQSGSGNIKKQPSLQTPSL